MLSVAHTIPLKFINTFSSSRTDIELEFINTFKLTLLALSSYYTLIISLTQKSRNSLQHKFLDTSFKVCLCVKRHVTEQKSGGHKSNQS